MSEEIKRIKLMIRMLKKQVVINYELGKISAEDAASYYCRRIEETN